jgi:sugar lactone lactonase YvrE
MSQKRELFLSDLVFPECPRWRQQDEELWLSDVFGKKVIRASEDGESSVVVEIPGRPSGLGFLPDGRLLVVSQEDAKVYVLNSDGLAVYADVGELGKGPPNDLVVTKSGRAYLSPFGFDMYGGGVPALSNLLAIETDGTVREVATEMLFPNGMVLSADEHTLIAAETGGGRLSAFDITGDGGLTNRRAFAELNGASPDGICLDDKGAVWVASFYSGEFLRVEEGGNVTDRIEVPGRRAVACNLGGEDGKTLFLLSAATDVEKLSRGESEGWVETVRVDVPSGNSP